MFFYSTMTVSVRTQNDAVSSFDPLRCNATKCYLEHYVNFLSLDHISKYGTIDERFQANQEMEICKRKMTYWKRQPHFDASVAMARKARLHCGRT